MMTPGRPTILSLDWEEENESHIEQHTFCFTVEEILEDGQWYAFPNKQGHPPNRFRIIGRTQGGVFLTIIIEPSRTGIYGHWRPTTAWPSEEYEKELFRRAQRGK